MFCFGFVCLVFFLLSLSLPRYCRDLSHIQLSTMTLDLEIRKPVFQQHHFVTYSALKGLLLQTKVNTLAYIPGESSAEEKPVIHSTIRLIRLMSQQTQFISETDLF